MLIVDAPKQADALGFYHNYNTNGDIKLFLAGGITNCPDWQEEVISGLADINEDYGELDRLVIYNPRRKNFPINNPSATREQIEWEFNHLQTCDIFSIYFTNGESDQPICMYELRRNVERMKMRYPASQWADRIIISVEEGYRRKQDVLIQTELALEDRIKINVQASHDQCVKKHIDMIHKAVTDLEAKKYGH